MLAGERLSDSQIEEFFHDNNKCLQLLSELKWVNGFICRKCGNDNYCDGKVPFSRRCTRCKNEESATSNTLFHNIKFPLNKAFFIAYQVFFNKKEISLNDLSRDLDIRQITCWNFIHKVENKIARISNFNTTGKITLQELLVANTESPFI